MNNSKLHEKYFHDIKEKLSEIYGIEENKINYLNISVNLVFICEEKNIVIRVSHRPAKTKEIIKAEIEWLLYLKENGVNVPEPLKDLSGNYIEEFFIDGISFKSVAFEKLNGRKPVKDDFTDEMIEKWGETMGKMHKLSKTFHPDNKRYFWYEDDNLVNYKKYIPEKYDKVREKFEELIGRLKKLPVDKDSFGLIHTDFNPVNFFLNEKEIEVFDFDESNYGWYVYDISVPFIERLAWIKRDGMDSIKAAEEIFKIFMKGYNKENYISQEWIDRFPLLLKLYEMLDFVYYSRTLDFDNLTDEQKEFIEESAYNIENDVIYFGIYANNIYPQLKN